MEQVQWDWVQTPKRLWQSRRRALLPKSIYNCTKNFEKPQLKILQLTEQEIRQYYSVNLLQQSQLLSTNYYCNWNKLFSNCRSQEETPRASEDNTVLSTNNIWRRSTPSRFDKSMLPIDSFYKIWFNATASQVFFRLKQSDLHYNRGYFIQRRIHCTIVTLMRTLNYNKHDDIGYWLTGVRVQEWNYTKVTALSGVKLHKSDCTLQECKATTRHLKATIRHLLSTMRHWLSIMIHYLFWHINIQYLTLCSF